MMVVSKICIQLVGSQYVILNPREIICIEADRQVCHFIMQSGNKLSAAHHLGYYKSGLLQDGQFAELSKSLLVNMLHVVRYAPRERTMEMSTGKLLVISKSRQEVLNRLFREWHDKWNPKPAIDEPDITGEALHA